MAKGAAVRRWVSIDPVQYRVRCFYIHDSELDDPNMQLEGVEGVVKVTREDFPHGLVLIVEINPEYDIEKVIARARMIIVGWCRKNKIELSD